MLIGVPKEIKTHEYRVGLVPESVRDLVESGHNVLVESGAGRGIVAEDEHYEAAGATMVPSREKIFEKVDMIVKVKEPQIEECQILREGQVLFTYLHLAPDRKQTEALCASGCTAIAYETVTDERGGLPLLAPMSEIAGRMSIQVGAHCLETAQGGRGILLGGVPGTLPAKVVVIGAGASGSSAVRIAAGVGADITVLDLSIEKLRSVENIFANTVRTAYSSAAVLERLLAEADLVVGAVLVPGANAPKVISREMLKGMKRGSVVVDIAIDQGGCLETSKPTTHAEPTFVEEDVVHYCVTNMPGVVAQSSSYALNNVTLPYARALAAKGWERAVAEDAGLRNGVNVSGGKVTYEAVARAQGREYSPLN